MPYYKMKDNEVVFQPLTRDSEETFSVWDNNNKKYLKGDDEVALKSGTVTAEKAKFIKWSDEDKKVFNRSVQFNREVVIEGEEFTFGMKKSAESALVTTMNNVEKLGKNPLAFSYVLKKEGTGLDTKYSVEIGKEVGLPSSYHVDIETEMKGVSNKLVLTKAEQEVVEALKREGSKYSKEQWLMYLTKKFNANSKESTRRVALMIEDNYPEA